jgi:hypothetical protein
MLRLRLRRICREHRADCDLSEIARREALYGGLVFIQGGYNLVAIPVAAGLLVGIGIDLPMAVGAVAMSASTIIVAANAQLLRGLRLRSDGPASGRTAPIPA